VQYSDFGKTDFKIFHQAMGSVRLLFVRKNYGNGLINQEICPAAKQHNRVMLNASP